MINHIDIEDIFSVTWSRNNVHIVSIDNIQGFDQLEERFDDMQVMNTIQMLIDFFHSLSKDFFVMWIKFKERTSYNTMKNSNIRWGFQ